MMHPTLVATLAAEHRTDMLRAAEGRRRVAALAPAERRTVVSRAAGGLSHAVTLLRGRLAAATQPQGDLCCA